MRASSWLRILQSRLVPALPQKRVLVPGSFQKDRLWPVRGSFQRVHLWPAQELQRGCWMVLQTPGRELQIPWTVPGRRQRSERRERRTRQGQGRPQSHRRRILPEPVPVLQTYLRVLLEKGNERTRRGKRKR
jgi:hypothetical protein